MTRVGKLASALVAVMVLSSGCGYVLGSQGADQRAEQELKPKEAPPEAANPFVKGNGSGERPTSIATTSTILLGTTDGATTPDGLPVPGVATGDPATSAPGGGATAGSGGTGSGGTGSGGTGTGGTGTTGTGGTGSGGTGSGGTGTGTPPGSVPFGGGTATPILTPGPTNENADANTLEACQIASELRLIGQLLGPTPWVVTPSTDLARLRSTMQEMISRFRRLPDLLPAAQGNQLRNFLAVNSGRLNRLQSPLELDIRDELRSIFKDQIDDLVNVLAGISSLCPSIFGIDYRGVAGVALP